MRTLPSKLASGLTMSPAQETSAGPPTPDQSGSWLVEPVEQFSQSNYFRTLLGCVQRVDPEVQVKPKDDLVTGRRRVAPSHNRCRMDDGFVHVFYNHSKYLNMDLTPELIAAGTEVAKNAALSLPFTGFIKSMLGPASDEIAAAWHDSLRVWRYGRQLEQLKKAEKMAIKAGFTPRAVPAKLLFPLLEGASFEEDEDLHTMWAALLANASNPETPNLVHPSFAGTLKQLTPNDAVILNNGFDSVAEALRSIHILRPKELLARSLQGLTFNRWDRERGRDMHLWTDEQAISYSSLQSAFLVERWFGHGGNALNLTPKGYYFVLACRAPAPKK